MVVMNLFRLTDSEQLQSLRDIYVAHHAIEQEDYSENHLDSKRPNGRLGTSPHSVLDVFAGFVRQFIELFTQRRNRNALIAASVVNLSQQLCGSKCWNSQSNNILPLDGQIANRRMQSMSWLSTLVQAASSIPIVRDINPIRRHPFQPGRRCPDNGDGI